MRRIIVLTTTLLMLSPVAAAGWGVFGDMEPNTGYDTRDGYMWQGPPQTTADAGKVYFNGWLSNAYIVRPQNNPNVAALGSSVAAADAVPWALLGVWRDCNKDGYVGYGDPGLWEYRANLPGVDTTLCKAETVPNPIPHRNWAPVHNDGTWIHEFIPIGWDRWGSLWDDDDPQNEKMVVTVTDDAPWDFNDTGARVWVDYMRPEARYGGGFTCYIVGWQRGTFQSAGGLVENYDCLASFRVTDALTAAGNAGADGTALGQLSFKDKPRDQSNSTSRLNVANPWGQESDAEYVDHWDCSQPQTRVDDPLSNQPDDFLINVSTPKVPTGVNAAGSPSGQVNATQGGFDQCGRSKTGDNDAKLAYALESDITNSGRYQVKTDDTLTYNRGLRRGGPFQTFGGGPGTPHDLGARVTGLENCVTHSSNIFAASCNEGTWEGTTTTLLAGSTFVNRNTLSPNPVRYVTWYASVSAAATSKYGFKFPGTTGSYGAENCALPLHERVFECDPALWWPGTTMLRSTNLGAESADKVTQCTDDGSRTAGCMPIGVRVGQSYQLRDVDCFDHSVDELRAEGVHWGILTATACR